MAIDEENGGGGAVRTETGNTGGTGSGTAVRTPVVSGASLQPIYERLNNVPAYHPLEADTFADWSMEAGDIVTVTRDGKDYESPVHTSNVTWKKRQMVSISSTGKEKRDPVSKIAKQKYRRSAAGMQNDRGIYSYVYASESTLYSYIDQTATYIVAHVEDVANDLGSEILQTASQIRAEVHASNSALYSYVDQTATYIVSHVEDVENDLGSEILQTASQIRSEVHAADSMLYTYVDQTATYILSHVEDVENDLGSEILQTASQIRSEVHASTSSLYSYVDQTATYINAHIEDVNNALGSEILQTASQIRSEVHASDSELYSYVDQTATYINSHIEDVNNSLGSEILQTASQIRSEVHAAESTTYSYIDQTASSITSHVEDVEQDLSSEILQTASQIRSEVHASNSQIYSYVDQTATSITSHVEDVANDLGSEILQTASQIRSEVHAADSALYSYVDQTATYIEQGVASTESSLRSSIRQQSDRISLVVEGTGNNAHIKAAEIAASINENGSQALISADHVLINSGTTKISDIFDVDANGVVSVFGDMDVNGDVFANDIEFTGTLSGYYGSSKYSVHGLDLRDMIIKAAVDTSTNTLKLWKRGDDPDGTPSITFEKAASIQNLTGAWSGSGNNQVLTVSTNPSTGKIYTVGFGTSDDTNLHLLSNGTPTMDSSNSKYLNVPLKIVSWVNGSPPTETPRYTETFTVNATPVWNDGYDYDIPNGIGLGEGWKSIDVTDSTHVDWLDSSAFWNAVSDSGTYKFGISIHGQTKYFYFNYNNKRTASNGNPGYMAGYSAGKSDEKGLVKTRFNYTGSQSGTTYYIEAYENTSSPSSISGSSTNYKLGTSGSTTSTKVQIQTTSGSQIANTPEISVGYLYTQGISDAPRAISYFSTSAPNGATYGNYTNNSDGYQLISSGVSGEAAIVIKGNIDIDSAVSREAYNYLYAAPTALYRKGFTDGYGDNLPSGIAIGDGWVVQDTSGTTNVDWLSTGTFWNSDTFKNTYGYAKFGVSVHGTTKYFRFAFDNRKLSSGGNPAYAEGYTAGKDYYNKSATLYCKSITPQSSGYYLYTFTVEYRSGSQFTQDTSYTFHYR